VTRRSLVRRGLEAAVRAVVLAWSRATLPRRRGTLRVPGLAGGAEATYDEHGVPHVRAAGDADALRALGACHALDRYFQMDMLRRALRGRISEVVGERPLGDLALPPFGRRRTTVDADRLVRTLDLLPSARRTLAAGDDEGRALLEAYVQGVNAAVEVLRRRRPPEYRAIGLPILRWSPVDSLVIAKGMALGLSFKWRTVPVLGAVADALEDEPARLAAILPTPPRPGGFAQARWAIDEIGRTLSFLPFGAPAVGSNAFLVGSGRSRSGKPILANDPHLELSLPGIWYLASVRGDRYAAVGATIPGAPGVVIGRTPTFAWGLTNAMIDDGDVWTEELDGTGTRYRVDGAWRDLLVETQSIPRRGTSPVLVRVRRTHRGPILSDAFPGYDGPAISLRLTFFEPGRDLEAFLGLGRARSARDVPAAVGGYGSPAQNLLYADVEGRAGYRLIGRVPMRPGDGDPCLPRDGRTAASDWTGYVPEADLPAYEVGPQDHAVSANNPQADGAYPHYLSDLYEPDYRAERIHELLGRRTGLTAEDLAAVQRDHMNPGAVSFRRAVLAPNAEAVRRTRPGVARLLDRLLAWDGTESVDAAGALVWHLVYNHLVRRVFGPAVGPVLVERWMGLINFVDAPLLRAFEDPASPWVAPGVRATLLGEALEDAEKDLAARGLGPDAPWGAAHVLTLHHPAGMAPLLGATFDRGPFPMPGGPYAVCSGQYLHHRPVAVGVGPSYRQVVDLGDPEGTSRMMTFGGQSGHVGSKHYDDLTPLWLRGAWIPMRLDSVPAGGPRIRFLPA
jgi:penicillin amidase